MTNNFGKKGLYNSQEIGLGRGLSELGHEVIIYKTVVHDEEVGEDQLNERINIQYIKCCHLGSNGYLSTRLLDKSADILIQFADIQLSVPMICRWAEKNGIRYIPYVGIIWSQSPNRIVRLFTEALARQNFRIFRKHGCVAKNTNVVQQLRKIRVHDIRIAPVCIDFEQLNKKCFEVEAANLRQKWGIPISKRVFLFVGRLEKDKRPISLVHMLKQLKDDSCLIMIGTGVLLDELKEEIKKAHLSDQVFIFEQIPNKEIWQFYRMADALVNLNKTEIWGMVLLEAMYYKVGVIAADAPGPRCIIQNGKSGFLAKSDEDFIEYMKIKPFPRNIISNAFDRVTTEFNWKNSAKILIDMQNN